jgi:hypothetical protein
LSKEGRKGPGGGGFLLIEETRCREDERAHARGTNQGAFGAPFEQL